MRLWQENDGKEEEITCEIPIETVIDESLNNFGKVSVPYLQRKSKVSYIKAKERSEFSSRIQLTTYDLLSDYIFNDKFKPVISEAFLFY